MTRVRWGPLSSDKEILECKGCGKTYKWLRLLSPETDYRCERCLYDVYGPLAYGMYEGRLKWEWNEALR
jgi:hypothetical protein